MHRFRRSGLLLEGIPPILPSMKRTSILLAAVALSSVLALAAGYDLGTLAKSNGLAIFNRTLDQTKAGAPEVVYLNSADGYGLAWIIGVKFSTGIIELELKGRDKPGQSFVGIAFHGQDDQTFDAVYLRPFNFRAAEAEHRGHSIQYISLPEHDWSELRQNHPGKYESALIPAPAPESWIQLKLVVKAGRVSAYLNRAEKPALTVELLNKKHQGKVGLWVGNGSDGWFRNLKITADAS